MTTQRQHTVSPHPVSLVLRTMWRSMAPWGGIVLLGLVLIYVVIDALMLFFGAKPDSSMVTIASAGALKYVLFSYGISIIWMLLQVYVTFGVTRRHLAISLGIFAASVAAVVAVVIVLGYAVEHAVYLANGILPGIKNYPYHSGADVIPLFLENWLVLYAHLIAGGLIVMFYARLGGLVGTLLLPVAVAPVLLTENVFGANWLGLGLNALFHSGPAPWPVATLVSLVVCGLGLVVNYLIMRRLPIGQKISVIRY